MVSTKGEKKKTRLMTTIEKVNVKYNMTKELSTCRAHAQNCTTRGINICRHLNTAKDDTKLLKWVKAPYFKANPFVLSSHKNQELITTRTNMLN